MPRPVSQPITASFPTTHALFGAGVAIFHLATARVILLSHPASRGYFLPKGRRDAGEDMACTASREGYEESGYRCALLAVPGGYVAPRAPGDERRWHVEPVFVQFLPVGEGGWAQYVLSWYAGRTMGQDEHADDEGTIMGWKEADRRGEGWWEPVRTEGTGVDDEERAYVAHLVPVDEALGLLRGSVQVEVVRRAWAAIQLRDTMEQEDGK